jgi:zinc transport system ATP-binding protein
MPHSGSIRIEWRRERVIGYVPQALEFDKSLPITVLDFMAMTTQRRPVFLGVSRERRRLIEAVLERMGISGKFNARLGSLSGGECQRVLFALVLDEPMTGLDLAGRKILEDEITAFARAGGTVVWVNHDIVQVSEFADALTYVNRKVLLDGAPDEVLASGMAAHLFPTLALAAREVSGA